MAAGSSIKASAGGRGLISVSVKIEGVEKTSDEFKAIRRDINMRMRDVMQRVGEHELLPMIRAGFPRLSTPKKGIVAGAMAGSLRIQRERSGVFVSSTLRGPKNRALGWVDFGGKRARDTQTRAGSKVIVRSLDAKRALIDSRVLQELEREFRAIDNA
jgi:hypothetical protein